jgi:predicted esterase
MPLLRTLCPCAPPTSPLARSRTAVLIVVLLAAAAAPLAAQLGPPPPAEMRDRLGLGYLRLELALRDAAARGLARDSVTRIRLNGGFDQVTLQFFMGNHGSALDGLDAMVAELGGDAGLDERATRILAALNAERRSVAVAGVEIQYLVHLPAAERPTAGWPVVVAMHGMGGDERMFFGGYGAGIIRELADRHGLAVVTPRGPTSPGAVLALVDALAAEHRLDATRVGLLGHSMGAGVAGRTAAANPERVRAVVCIAGGCGGPTGGSAADASPMFLFAGARDPLFRIDSLVAAAEEQRQGGRSVEVRRMESEGHTLIVAEVLPDALAWLAGRLRG